MTKVALLHEIPSPYRSPLFEGLANHERIELKVVLTGLTEVRRSWDVSPERIQYPFKLLTSHTVDLRGEEGFTVFFPRGLVAYLNEFSPDVVIVGGYATPMALLGMAWARARRRGLVVWSESTHRSDQSAATAWIKKRLLTFPDHFLVPGDLSAQNLVALGVDRAQIGVAPNNIDLTEFSPLPRQLNKGHLGTLEVLMVGSLISRKGFDIALRALAATGCHSRFRVTIVGEGAGDSALRHLAQDLGLRCEMLGHVEYGDLPDVFRSADLFLFPSREDIWGFALQEAAACGLPVVASSSAGAAFDLVLDGVNGWQVNPTVRDFTTAIRRFLELSPVERERMGGMSRRLAENLSTERAVDAFVEAADYVAAEIESK